MSGLSARMWASVLRHQDALVAAFLGLLVLSLGAHTLDRFWHGDDTPVLAHALQYPLFDIFFVPAVWQELSTANLTPWISLSFYLDYALAGPAPWAFHLHHLVSLWLVAVVTVRLLSLFTARWLAWLGAMLFLLGTPVLHISDQLFTRHYLEGLLFCLLALYCFIQYQGRGAVLYQFAGVLFYLLAMAAKEIYVPLAVLLLFMSTGTAAQKARQVLPYCAVLALYLLWRGHMLSGHVGGYAQGSTYLDAAFWKEVALSFAGIPALLFGTTMPFISLALPGTITVGLLMRPQRLPLAALMVALVFLPLVPLVAYPGITTADRYLFLPWYLLCFAFIVATQDLLRECPGPRIGKWASSISSVLGAVIALALAEHRSNVQRSEVDYYAAIDTQMRYAWEHDSSTAFLPDAGIASSYGMVRALGEVKQLLDPAASIPRAILDARDIDAELPLYAYSADCTCMKDISGTIAEQSTRFHRTRRHAPLSLTVTNDDGWVAWRFGPYDNGTYNVISDYIGNLPLPATQGGLRTNLRKELEITLRYTAPEGWVTYSPPLRLKPDGEVLAWSRGAP